jgi:histidine phosphotransfer protein HptB
MTDNMAPLDQSALDALREMTGDDPAFMTELIDTFVDDSRHQCQAMTKAASSGDAVALRRAAHSLKSNSATFGAMELAELCQTAETRAKRGELDGIAALLERIDSALEQAHAALETLRVAGQS